MRARRRRRRRRRYIVILQRKPLQRLIAFGTAGERVGTISDLHPKVSAVPHTARGLGSTHAWRMQAAGCLVITERQCLQCAVSAEASRKLLGACNRGAWTLIAKVRESMGVCACGWASGLACAPHLRRRSHCGKGQARRASSWSRARGCTAHRSRLHVAGSAVAAARRLERGGSPGEAYVGIDAVLVF